jgi:hypothetical protein
MKRSSRIMREPEQPMQSFNKLCFGMMNNDWILVASSGVKLIVGVALFLQVYNKSL